MVNKYYVPILKSKRGEMAALRKTYDDVLNHIVPLVEVLAEYTKTKASVYKKLKRSWRGDRMLIDTHYCGAESATVLNKIKNELSDVLRVIPVIYTNSPTDVVDTAKEIMSVSRRGMCLRVNKEDLDETLAIKRFIDENRIDKSKTVLLVDMGFMCDEKAYVNLIEKINRISNLHDFNALVVASGCSPDSLAEFNVGEDNFIERLDWQFWSKYHNTLNRESIYGDYTTQHPFVMPPGNYPGSKSIRYTIKDRVAIYRGKQSDPLGAYLEHAAQLCDYSDYYCGEDYSYGDLYLKERSDIFNNGETDGTGNSTTWVTMRVNHHIAFVVKHDLGAVTTQ